MQPALTKESTMKQQHLSRAQEIAQAIARDMRASENARREAAYTPPQAYDETAGLALIASITTMEANRQARNQTDFTL